MLSNWLGSEVFPWRMVISILIPLTLDQFSANLIAVLCTSMISTSSQASVSAVSLVNPAVMMLLTLYEAIGAGGAVIAAQYKGRGDMEKVRHSIGQVMTLNIVLSLCLTAVVIAGAPTILSLLYRDLDPVVMEKAVRYLRFVSLSLPCYSIFTVSFSGMRGVGATKVCLGMAITVNIAYLLGSLLFINVLHLDVVGTALALIVARLISMSLGLILVTRPRIVGMGWRHMVNISRPILRSVRRLATPFAVEQVLTNGAALLVGTFMVQLGTQAVAVNAVASSAVTMLYCMGLSAGHACVTLVGQCIGRGDKDLARKYARSMVQMGTLVVMLMVVLGFFLLDPLLALYNAPQETYDQVKMLMYIAMAALPFIWPAANVMPNALRAAGDANFTSILSMLSLWGVRVGLGYLLAIPLGLGVVGMWVAMMLEWAVRGLASYIRYRGNAWLNKKTLEE